MKLTFLGTGAMSAVGKRNPTAIILEADKKLILMDCGFGALAQMAKKGFDFMKIDAILVTHTHTDHVSDLLPIIHSMAVLSDFEPKRARKEALNVYGPKDLSKLYKLLRHYEFADKLEKFEIKIHSFGNREAKIGNIKIESMVVDHLPKYISQALAYKISLGEKSIVFSGDIDWGEKIPKFIEFCKDIDLLIIDGGKPIGKREGAHLEPFQISQIAFQANPKTLIVTHQNDLNSPAEIKDAIAEFYKGEVYVARDGMEMEV